MRCSEDKTERQKMKKMWNVCELRRGVREKDGEDREEKEHADYLLYRYQKWPSLRHLQRQTESIEREGSGKHLKAKSSYNHHSGPCEASKKTECKGKKRTN